jgi:hypothetical protein
MTLAAGRTAPSDHRLRFRRGARAALITSCPGHRLPALPREAPASDSGLRELRHRQCEPARIHFGSARKRCQSNGMSTLGEGVLHGTWQSRATVLVGNDVPLNPADLARCARAVRTFCRSSIEIGTSTIHTVTRSDAQRRRRARRRRQELCSVALLPLSPRSGRFGGGHRPQRGARGRMGWGQPARSELVISARREVSQVP